VLLGCIFRTIGQEAHMGQIEEQKLDGSVTLPEKSQQNRTDGFARLFKEPF
jgi:hypothetical protein